MVHSVQLTTEKMCATLTPVIQFYEPSVEPGVVFMDMSTPNSDTIWMQKSFISGRLRHAEQGY